MLLHGEDWEICFARQEIIPKPSCVTRCFDNIFVFLILLFVKQAIRVKLNYADAYTGMGVSLKELKRKDEAAACFERVVKLRPGCALSLGNLAGAS